MENTTLNNNSNNTMKLINLTLALTALYTFWLVMLRSVTVVPISALVNFMIPPGNLGCLVARSFLLTTVVLLAVVTTVDETGFIVVAAVKNSGFLVVVYTGILMDLKNVFVVDVNISFLVDLNTNFWWSQT